MSGSSVDAFLAPRLDDYIAETARLCAHPSISAHRLGLPECADMVASGTKSVVVTTVDRANDLGKQLAAPGVALIKATPLGSLFTESPEDQAAKARDSQVHRAASQATQQADAFIKSNR